MVLISEILKRYLHKESFLALVVLFVFTDKLSKVRLTHTGRTASVTRELTQQDGRGTKTANLV